MTSSKHILAAEREVVGPSGRKGLVVSINIYLPAENVIFGWRRDSNNQVEELFRNAFRYAMGYVLTQNVKGSWKKN